MMPPKRGATHPPYELFMDELRRILLPRTPVNKGKREDRHKKAGVTQHRLSAITCSYLPAGRAVALTVIARHHRRVGRVPLVRGGTAAPLRARLGLPGESDSTKRHRQRHHQRHHQHRNPLPHLLTSSPFSPTRKPAYLFQ